MVMDEGRDLSSKESCGRLANSIQEAGVDGVVCCRDVTALGVTLELLSRGVRVPQDVAVAGFDDSAGGSNFSVGVAAYTISADQIAKQAIRQMRERRRNPGSPPIQILIQGRLIVRETTD
jgi:DNA-binding LacI/PurR family transcriptional regulator